MTYMMSVKRVPTATGVSEVQPPLDPGWSSFKKLVWHAAVASLDSGVCITVEPAEYSIQVFGIKWPVGGAFNVSAGRSTSGPHNFASAWSYINGIVTGARAVNA
jgi:hypothetical protein